MTSPQVANTPHEPLLEHVRPLRLRVMEMTALSVPPVHDPRPGTSLYLGLDGIAAARISPYPKRRTDRRVWTATVVTPALTASPRYEEFFGPRAVAAQAGRSGH